MQDQRNASAAGIDSTVGESSPPERVPSKDKTEENFEPLNLNVQQVVVEDDSRQGITPPVLPFVIKLENGVETTTNVEHQFIPSFTNGSLVHHQNKGQENQEPKSLSNFRNRSDEGIYVSLQLGEPEPKKRKQF